VSGVWALAIVLMCRRLLFFNHSVTLRLDGCAAKKDGARDIALALARTHR
jgi:hypothetical protein